MANGQRSITRFLMLASGLVVGGANTAPLSNRIVVIIAAIAGLLEIFSGAAFSQPCVPHWENAIGQPGMFGSAGSNVNVLKGPLLLVNGVPTGTSFD